jgi:hypothetical protein
MSVEIKTQFRSNPSLGQAKSLWLNDLQGQGHGRATHLSRYSVPPLAICNPHRLNGLQAVGPITDVMLT